MRYAVILNPAAGHGRAGRKRVALEEALIRSGLTYDLFISDSPDHTSDLARNSVHYADAVLAVGGDGTFRDVARGLVDCGASVPIGIIPMGTGNDFQRNFPAPRRLADVIEALGQAHHTLIDYGVVSWTEDNRCGRTVFFNAVGIGVDAAVAMASLRFKWLRGKAAYLAAVPQILASWTAPHVRIAMNPQGAPYEMLHEEALFLMTVANGISSGGGFHLTPEASLSDGRLDVCLVKGLSTWRVLQLLPRAVRGTHTRAHEVTMRRITSLSLESDVPLPVHADGEVITRAARKLSVHIVTNGLHVLVP